MLLRLCPNREGLGFFLVVLAFLVVSATAQDGTAREPSVQDEDPVTTRKEAYYHYSLGVAHQLDGEFEKAISEFELAMEADPGNPHLMSRFASALSKGGYIGRAVEMRQKAAELRPEEPGFRYALARSYFDYRAQENMRKKAEAELERTLELDPGYNPALMDIGQIYWETGRWEKVISTFSKLRQLDPTIVRAYLAEAQALEKLGRLEEAVDVLTAGLNVGEEIPDYMLLLGSYLEQLGRNERAVEVYLTGMENSSDPQETQFKQKLAFLYNNIGRYGDALPLLEELNEQYPQISVVKVELSRSLRHTGKVEEAREVLEKAIILDPDNLQANYELSVVLAITGERKRAIEVLERLLILDEDKGGEFRDHFLTRLALLYRDENRYRESIEASKAVIDRNSEDIDSWLRLLTTYREADMDREAEALSRELLEENPDDPYVIIGRGQTLAAIGRVEEGFRFLRSSARATEDSDVRDMIYMVLGQMMVDEERFADAHRVTDEALSLNPESDRLKFLKASVYEREGQIAAAEKVFRELLASSPDDTSVLNYLGYMLVENDMKLEEAGELLERAVSLEPYNGAFQDSLGWLYFKKGEYEKAERHLSKANRLETSDPVILEHLGDLYTSLGDTETASEYYRLSMEAAESGEEVERIRKKLQDSLRGSE